MSESVIGNMTDLVNEFNDVKEDVNNKIIGIENTVSDKYDSSKTYIIGDYVIFNNTIYKCITDVEISEEFDAEKWEEYTVTSLIKTTEKALNDSLVGFIDTSNIILNQSVSKNSSFTWTCTANCWVRVKMGMNASTNSDAGMSIYINGVPLDGSYFYMYQASGFQGCYTQLFPLKKGQILKVTASNGNIFANMSVYAVGML